MKQSHEKELVELMSKITDPSVMKAFLKAILTPTEFEDIVMRLQLVKMLEDGVPQREISKKLGVSIAKVTRGSRELQTKGNGFTKVLETFYKK